RTAANLRSFLGSQRALHGGIACARASTHHASSARVATVANPLPFVARLTRHHANGSACNAIYRDSALQARGMANRLACARHSAAISTDRPWGCCFATNRAYP